MTNDIWGAAIHESGHAIAVLHYRDVGFNLTLVGKCRINEWGDAGSTNVIRDEENALPTQVRLALAYAGGAAQKQFDAPTSSPKALEEDEAHADKITAHLQPAHRLAAQEMGRKLAAKIIAENDSEVRRLATVLTEKFSIEMADLPTLARPAPLRTFHP
jgi:hypothetical protein